MESVVTKIVIVDDDASVGRALSRLVRSFGMNAESFLSGEAFLRAVDPSGKPDCLVLDVQMPGMNGLEVQQQLIERELTLPVVFITAHDNCAVVERAISAGAVGFLRKPFSEGSFRAILSRALDRQG